MSPPISKPALDASSALGSLRLQAAVVRALLDEVEERTPPPGTTDDLIDQLSDELERLGRGALQAAEALGRCRSSAPPAPHSPGAEVEVDPIPYGLPIVSF